MSKASPDLRVIRLEEWVCWRVARDVYEVVCLLLFAFLLLAVIDLSLIESLLIF